jgi:hypothetical protein
VVVVGWAGERFLRQRIGNTNVSCTRLGCTSYTGLHLAKGRWAPRVHLAGGRVCIWPEAA